MGVKMDEVRLSPAPIDLGPPQRSHLKARGNDWKMNGTTIRPYRRWYRVCSTLVPKA